MKTITEQINEFVEDYVCNLRPGSRVHVVMVQRHVESKISLYPPHATITQKLNEMSQGEEPELLPRVFGWYEKLRVESNHIITSAQRTPVLE